MEYSPNLDQGGRLRVRQEKWKHVKLLTLNTDSSMQSLSS